MFACVHLREWIMLWLGLSTSSDLCETLTVQVHVKLVVLEASKTSQMACAWHHSYSIPDVNVLESRRREQNENRSQSLKKLKHSKSSVLKLKNILNHKSFNLVQTVSKLCSAVLNNTKNCDKKFKRWIETNLTVKMAK